MAESKSFLHRWLTALIVPLAIIGAAWVAWRSWPWSPVPAPRVNERITLSVLKTEALAFLVTRRMTTQVVVEHEESDWLGDWHGVLWATVSWQWGVDLAKIKESDLRRDGDAVYVRIPDPELLGDITVVPDSIRFVSKSTAVPKLKDLFNGDQEQTLRRQLKTQAMQFAHANGMCPTRTEMIQQLNGSLGKLASGKFKLVFE